MGPSEFLRKKIRKEFDKKKLKIDTRSKNGKYDWHRTGLKTGLGVARRFLVIIAEIVEKRHQMVALLEEELLPREIIHQAT